MITGYSRAITSYSGNQLELGYNQVRQGCTQFQQSGNQLQLGSNHLRQGSTQFRQSGNQLQHSGKACMYSLSKL